MNCICKRTQVCIHTFKNLKYVLYVCVCISIVYTAYIHTVHVRLKKSLIHSSHYSYNSKYCFFNKLTSCHGIDIRLQILGDRTYAVRVLVLGILLLIILRTHQTSEASVVQLYETKNQILSETHTYIHLCTVYIYFQ